MAMRSPVDRFRAATEAMTPARLLVLLYERLLRDLDDAEAGFDEGDRYAAHRALLHAQEIVSELDRALDPDVWPEAPKLSDVYRFVSARLVSANLHQDVTAVRDCRTVLAPLLETWREAWQQNAAGAIPATATPADPDAGSTAAVASTAAAAAAKAAAANPTDPAVRPRLDVAG